MDVIFKPAAWLFPFFSEARDDSGIKKIESKAEKR